MKQENSQICLFVQGKQRDELQCLFLQSVTFTLLCTDCTLKKPLLITEKTDTYNPCHPHLRVDGSTILATVHDESLPLHLVLLQLFLIYYQLSVTRFSCIFYKKCTQQFLKVFVKDFCNSINTALLKSNFQVTLIIFSHLLQTLQDNHHIKKFRSEPFLNNIYHFL